MCPVLPQLFFRYLRGIGFVSRNKVFHRFAVKFIVFRSGTDFLPRLLILLCHISSCRAKAVQSSPEISICSSLPLSSTPMEVLIFLSHLL